MRTVHLRADTQIPKVSHLHFGIGFLVRAGAFKGEVGVLLDEEDGAPLGARDRDDLLENGFYQQRGVVGEGFPAGVKRGRSLWR